MENCLFCKFVSKEFKTDILYEDENMIVIKDITTNRTLSAFINHSSFLIKLYTLYDNENT